MSARMTFIIVCTACVLFVAGCAEECPTGSCPALTPGGLVEGQVSAGSTPLETCIIAHGIRYRYQVTAFSDSTGRYELHLPYGRYLLELETGTHRSHGWRHDHSFYLSGAGPVLSRTLADTFVLDAENKHIHLDPVLGGLEVTVSIPPDMEGEWLHLYAEYVAEDLPDNVRRHWRHESVWVEAQEAVFRFPGSYPGRCHLRIARERWDLREEFWLPSGSDTSQADIVTIAPDSTTLYEAEIQSSYGSLSGTITGSWQQLGNLRPEVRLFSRDSSLVATQDMPWPDGSFSISLADPKPVKMLIDIDGVQRWYGGRPCLRTGARHHDR
jgi:hypothetical protein